MACNEAEIDWDWHWWGISIEWKVTMRQAEEMEEAWARGEDGAHIAAIGLAKRGQAVPTAVAEAAAFIAGYYADDIGDAADGCGAVIKWRFSPASGLIPWYTISDQ